MGERDLGRAGHRRRHRGVARSVRSRPGLRASKRTRRAAEAEAGEGEGDEGISASAAAPQPPQVEEWTSEGAGAPAAAATAGSFDAVRSRPGLRASKRTRRAAEAEGEEDGEWREGS